MVGIVDSQLILGPGHLSTPQLGCCFSSSLWIGLELWTISLEKMEEGVDPRNESCKGNASSCPSQEGKDFDGWMDG